MSKQKFNIWERTLELDIVYDCYSGESILDSQKSAFKEFCNQAGTVFESAKKKAEEYCLKTNRREIDTDYIENIFKYVKPKAIYVKRSTSDERIVAILCAYKFNPDDGIAIVFKNESFSAIGTQNIIL